MNRNQVPIYILSFLTIFITTTFSTYSLGLYRAKTPESSKEERPTRLLHEQIRQNNFDEFVRMLDEYPQYINTACYYIKYDDYLTPLQSAAVLGRDDFIDELLKRKVDLFPTTTNKGNSILHLSKKPHITKRFIDLAFKLEAHNEQLMTPLLVQTYKTILNRGVILALLEAGANPNARTTSKLTPLHILFKPHHASNHREDLLVILEDLLDHGAKIYATTREGDTALHFAARNNDVEGIRIIVDRINQRRIKDFFINMRNSDGDTPLSIAYKHQSKEAITQLLKLGASPLLKNSNGISVNGDAYLHIRSNERKIFDFSKFVLYEIAKYFKLKPPDRCARQLILVSS